MSRYRVLEVTDDQAYHDFTFLQGCYDDNGGESNGDANFPADPGSLSAEEEAQVVEAGMGEIVEVYHYSTDEIMTRYGYTLDKEKDPDGYAIDQLRATLEKKGKRYSWYATNGDWYVEA